VLKSFYMKNERLQRTIDLLKRCGEAKGMTITEEEMAGKVGLSLQQLRACVEGQEPAPDRLRSELLRSELRAAYIELITAIRQEGYRNSLLSAIRAVRGFGSEVGVTITEEDMAGKIGMPFAQWEAYINGDQPTPANMTGLLMTAYDELHKQIQQRNLTVRLRSTMDIIQRMGEKKGKQIVFGDMARQLGMTAEELTACLHDPHQTHEGFSALSDRLREANAELLKNVRTVRSSSVHEVKMPLSLELDWKELGDE
jgi:hypothetical protein